MSQQSQTSPTRALRGPELVLPPIDPETRHVTRKVSRHLLGFLFLLYVISFLDRINIGFAGLTMAKDLGLSSMQFGLASTMFYITYIAFGVPSNVALARFGTRRRVGFIMIAWGVASTMTMFATNADTLYDLRIVVGITEAGFVPGMLLYLMYWFSPAYRARANALFMIAMPVKAALASAVSGYILGLDGRAGLAGSQWLFMLEGLPAAMLGTAAFFYRDDSPATARWLTDAEKLTLVAQLQTQPHARSSGARDAGSAVPSGSLLQQLISLTVVRYALACFCLVNTLAMVAVWTLLIVKSITTQASNATVGLRAIIPQIATIIAMIAWGRSSDRRQERKWPS